MPGCNQKGGFIMANTPENIPAEYQPISMWGYFCYELLFALPVVGFIFLIVFALGGTNNMNLRNFARSYFCFTIIAAILILILIISGVFGVAFGGALSYFQQ